MGGRRSLPHVGQEGQRKEGRGRGRRRGSEMRKKGNGEKSKGRDGEKWGGILEQDIFSKDMAPVIDFP